MGVSQTDSVHPDLNAAFSGGDGFVARVKELSDQRAAIAAMLKDLALGREARAAYDDARKKQEAAAKALSDAELRAGTMVNDATERSAKLLKDAQERHDKMTSDAGAVKKEADALLADARAKNLAAIAKEKEAVRVRDQHATALKTAQDTQRTFQDRISQLNNFLKAL